MKQILALLKYCTPTEVCAEAMEGGHFFVGKANLQECCEELACSLTNIKPVHEEEHARGNHWLLGPSEQRQHVKHKNMLLTLDYGSKSRLMQ